MKFLFPAIVCAAFSLNAEEPVALTAGGLAFTAPSEAWKAKEKPAQMSQGGFLYSLDGATAEADIFYFGAGQGGDVEANVTRWKGRFEGEPEFKQETIKTEDEKEIILVTITGTYLAGSAFGPKTPQPDSTLLGAIIPGPDANVFIRMAGPKALLEAAKEDFILLAKSPFTPAAE